LGVLDTLHRAVLLRPLNLPAPERLVRVTTNYARSGRGSATLLFRVAARDLRSFAIGAGLLGGTATFRRGIPRLHS
jgi:hypothetical protein